MSGKVSAAASASAGANIAGGKNVPATGPGSNPSAGAGANAGGGGRFSSALADAAHTGEHPADAQLSKPSADAAAEHSAPSSPALSATSPQIGADVPPLLSAAAVSPNSSALATTGNAGADKASGGKAGLKSGGDARTSVADSAPAAPSEPAVLAMLLAASGMQLSSAGGAGSATDAAAGAADSAGDSRQAGISVTRLAARIIAGLPASDAAADTAADPVLSAVASAMASPAPAATTATATAAMTATSDANSPMPAASAPDATNSAAAAANTTSTGTEVSDNAALPAAKSAIVDTTPAPPSIMTDSSGLPELVRSFAASATQAAPVQASISVPVGNVDWPHAVAAQVHWFVNNDVQSATLRLSPEHLGPVEVRIDVHDSQVNVNFSAAHAETRVALEQTVPRLREILAGGGLTLGQANVQQDPRPGSQPAASPARPAFTAAQAVEPVAVAAPQGLGLVDEYA